MLITTARDIGAAIRDRRKSLGIDQIELASRTGVSRQWLIQVEGGKEGATIGRLLRVFNVLGLGLSVNIGAEHAAGPEAEPPGLPDPSAILDRHRSGGRST
jgi:HTH-type transcriptional regulator/antitoxin HipB